MGGGKETTMDSGFAAWQETSEKNGTWTIRRVFEFRQEGGTAEEALAAAEEAFEAER